MKINKQHTQTYGTTEGISKKHFKALSDYLKMSRDLILVIKQHT